MRHNVPLRGNSYLGTPRQILYEVDGARISNRSRDTHYGKILNVCGPYVRVAAPNNALQPTGLSVQHFAKEKSKILATEPGG